jgi:hypothetical protein
MTKKIFLILLAVSFSLSACGGGATPDPALDPMLAMTSAFATVNAAFTQTALAIPTTPPAPTETPTLTPGPQLTQFSPTTTLTVTVKAQAYCRFGPNTVYAARFGVRTGKVLVANGRDATGQWLLLATEPGRKKSCWVNIIALDVQGDINTLAIAPVELPFTANYPPPPNVAARRNVDQVTISWGDVPVSYKVVYLDSHYFLELWLCNAGQLTYTLLGTNDLTVTVIDQTGCTEASHGLLYTTTKEGYSQPATIPWP